jgi:transmembrane sensor
LASSLGLATVTGVALLIADTRYPLHNFFAYMASGTGERRQFQLADGSDLLLDARSRVNIDFTHERRNIQLLAGAMSVEVAAHAGRPLTVHTLHGTVRALGTRFMVRQEAGRSLVVVQKHSVVVATLAGLQRTIEAGCGVRFDAAQVDLPRPELLADAAWQGGVIEVNNRPLMQVIAALRPYYKGVLRVSTAAGGLCVKGRYALDHVEGSLRALREQLPITVRRITPWLIFVDVAAA